MKIAVVQFPGSNCETESLRAVRAAGMEAEEFLWNEDHAKLTGYDGYFIIGGFSYEDRSRAGIIASQDPVMRVINEESKKGKPVLGICNGAQILVETGMVPGLENDAVGMALAVNKRVSEGHILGTGFYNAWTYMKLDADPTSTAFTRTLQKGDMLHVPIAHGEGRFLMPEGLLAEMKLNDMTPFRYCDKGGNISEDFPTNPNGAVCNLAAVTNTGGNVMAMMPHPERTTNGNPIFTSMRDYIESEQAIDLSPLSYTPNKPTLSEYQCPDGAVEVKTGLIITDNECETVRKTLEELSIHASLSRQTHWELSGPSVSTQETMESIMASGELFNSNKEAIDANAPSQRDQKQSISLLVRYRDDFVGESKHATLTDKLGISGIDQITKGTLWHITIERGNIDTLLELILSSRILYNQYSQTCQLYNA